MKSLPDRWGRWTGIEGLPLIVVCSSVLVYLFDMVSPGFIPLLTLSREAVGAGQWWRCVTFLFVPPFIDGFLFWRVSQSLGVLLMVFWFMFVYNMASSLERAWGTFRFTVYFLAGALATLSVAFFPGVGTVTNGYLQASLFLAFAALFPNVEVLVFFVIPIKVKWLGGLTWITLVWGLLTGDTATRLTVAAGLFNYFLILGPGLWGDLRLRWEVIRNRRRFQGRL